MSNNTCQPDCALVALDQYTLLSLEGTDATAFLQGQCTNDFANLADGAWSYGAHCDPKGRMQFSFLATRLTEHKIVLRLHESLAEYAQTSLKKYLVFSKSVLTRLNTWRGYAVLGANAETFPRPQSRDVLAHRHSTDCIELWLPETELDSATAPSLQEAHSRTLWERHQILAGIAELRSGMQGEFLPQEINLGALGGLSYKKGCYTGQEIIARLHYKGALKKHLYIGRTQLNSSGDVGNAIYEVGNDHQSLGTNLRWVHEENGKVLFLALVNDNAIESKKHCVLGTTDSVIIQWTKVPYAITD